MTLVARLLTLLTIAAAGFALPITCVQGDAAAAPEPVAIEIPAAQQLDAPQTDPNHVSEARQEVATLAHRALDRAPFDCGETVPRVTDHSGTFDAQPFVPGYLGSTFLLDEDQSDSFAPPVQLIPFESRAGPPDAPPPKSID